MANKLSLSELRLGNKVMPSNAKKWTPKYNGTIQTVDIDLFIDIFRNEDDFVPVEITEKILKQIGFETADNEIDCIVWDYKDEFTIVQNGQPVEEQPYIFEWEDGSNDHETELKYVHQLQNLYFALTGKELECNI